MYDRMLSKPNAGEEDVLVGVNLADVQGLESLCEKEEKEWANKMGVGRVMELGNHLAF